MDNPQVIKKTKTIDNEAIVTDQEKLKWLGGYFDALGSCLISHESCSVRLMNINPHAAFRIYSIFKNHGITSQIGKNIKSPKGKKKRWNLVIEGEEAFSAAKLILDFCPGKNKQLLTLCQYPRLTNKDYLSKMMSYLNKTNKQLIQSDKELWKDLGFEIKKMHQNVNEHNKKINLTNFDDWNYVAGLFDASAEIGLDRHEKKYRDTDYYNPYVKFGSVNKEIIESVFSTMKNDKIGCHINFSVPMTKNRGKWTITVSGVKRILSLSHYLSDKLAVRFKQFQLLYEYCLERDVAHKGVDITGQSCKEAIDALNRET